MTCTTDFNPLILAIAAAIPTLIGVFATWLALKNDLSHVKGRQYETLDNTKKLLYVVENGFHGPAGKPGPAGPPGVDAAAPAPPVA